jgi:hypothetical protein
VVLKVVKPPRPEAGPALVTLLVTRSPANELVEGHDHGPCSDEAGDHRRARRKGRRDPLLTAPARYPTGGDSDELVDGGVTGDGMDMHRPVWVKLSLVFPRRPDGRCRRSSPTLMLSTRRQRLLATCSSGFCER